jgi:hypothetical protein
MERKNPRLKLFTAQATSSTTAYASPWTSAGRNGNWHCEIEKTGTGTGNIAFQTNDRDETTFNADPTLGWKQHDFAAGSGVTSGKIDIAATDPSTYKFKIRGLAAIRVRVVVTNATGTMSISGTLNGN